MVRFIRTFFSCQRRNDMIYLDNSATTQPFERVIAKMDDVMRNEYYNVSAAYAVAMHQEQAVNLARKNLLGSLGMPKGRAIMTAGGTESDNLAILGFAETLHEPAVFLVSRLEHPAVLRTLERVERMGHEIRYLPVDREGRIDVVASESLMDERVAMLICMQVNNETGAVQPVGELIAALRKRAKRARVHVDGVQGYMRVPISLSKLGVDSYAISAHKIHGPKGIGCLVTAPDFPMKTQMSGGGQEAGFRSGTLNSPGILGMSEAVSEMTERGTEALWARKRTLVSCLSGHKGIFFNGPDPLDMEKSAPHILSVRFDGVRGEVMRNALEGENILVSTGSACGSHKQKVSATLTEMGLGTEEADGTIRVSQGMMNTEDEMRTAAEAMIRLYDVLSRYRRR